MDTLYLHIVARQMQKEIKSHCNACQTNGSDHTCIDQYFTKMNDVLLDKILDSNQVDEDFVKMFEFILNILNIDKTEEVERIKHNCLMKKQDKRSLLLRAKMYLNDKYDEIKFNFDGIASLAN